MSFVKQAINITFNTYRQIYFSLEYFPETKVRFQTSAPTFSAKTDLIPKDGINNAVDITLKDTNLKEVDFSIFFHEVLQDPV